ncbi:MAG TPA: hypothetical protein VNG71_21840 [Pyrinomonadaceae bacterium]|nr:hypothetical protein [Pyrinomonadaceae bacterium]
MPAAKFPGQGRKRPQLDLKVEQLHLDSYNPRLPEDKQGKPEADILSTLYQDFFLDEIAESMSRNGYFDEEPLVGIPEKLPRKLKNADPQSRDFLTFIKEKDTEFTIVEGNRRLATIRLLLNASEREKLRIKTWPTLSTEVADDLAVLPVIVYPTRVEIIPYLGVRHIIGIQKWDSYAKARYIAMMVKDGRTVDEVGDLIGDKQGSVNKQYLSYKLLDQAEAEFDLDLTKAKQDFSLLLLALGQGNIKQFLGLPKRTKDTNIEEPVPREKLEDLKDVLSWIFGDSKRLPVIKESRDITNYLSHVVASSEAVKYLKDRRDLTGAYDRTDGEEKMLLKYLNAANSKLEGALGIAHRHRTFEVIAQAERCEQTAKTLVKTVKE